MTTINIETDSLKRFTRLLVKTSAKLDCKLTQPEMFDRLLNEHECMAGQLKQIREIIDAPLIDPAVFPLSRVLNIRRVLGEPKQ